jgi:hypothetical protein
MELWAAFKRNSGMLWRRCGGDDELGGRDAWANGAQPRGEGIPDKLSEGDGEVLKQSLADDPRLDEDVISVKLAFDGVAVFGRGAVEMLIAVVAAQRGHVGHPEMIGERADLPDRLLEGVLDLETTATKRTIRPAGRHSRSRTRYWMISLFSP